jgi:hypothetical protein
MSSGYTIELDWEIVDKVVVGQLRNTWETLKGNLGNGDWVFVWGDQEADDAQIQKRIDALELLLAWYSTPDELVKMGLKEGA